MKACFHISPSKLKNICHAFVSKGCFAYLHKAGEMGTCEIKLEIHFTLGENSEIDLNNPSSFSSFSAFY